MTTLAQALYTTRATAQGGRSGHVASDDGMVSVDVRPPKELGGPGAAANPETLFAAGYAACFQGALMVVARRMQADATQSKVTVAVTFGKTPDGGYGLAAKISVAIPGVDRAKVQELVQAAHGVCPYSKATRGNIDVTLEAVE